MSFEDHRRDPDSLLQAIKEELQKKHEGKLKIFFGMAAGVGKTYEMLEEAHQLLKEGKDVVVGIINTHGRQDTAALLEGLPIIPEKTLRYKDANFKELDLDAILKRKPQLVLIDELAHTNIPGSRHPKRWQDVIEIIESGIDVFTTMNVQHLESRKEIVEAITGIPVRETVPDLILERATQIELIDITPPDLLKRLKEGKVYLGDMPKIAVENFFKEDHLAALREIALRFTAEKVVHDLQSMAELGEAPQSYLFKDCLLVAVDESAESAHLIRAARRFAYKIDIPWLVAYISDGSLLSQEERSKLDKNLSLARELGAEVITTADASQTHAIQKLINQKRVTQLVLKRPSKKNVLDLFKNEISLSKILEENPLVDVLVMREMRPEAFSKSQTAFKKFLSSVNFNAYWQAFGFILILTFFNAFLVPIVGYQAIGFIYLLGILVLSLFTSSGPILFGALLSGIALNYLFMDTPDATKVESKTDNYFFAIYLLTALIFGILVTRVRQSEKMLMIREKHAQILYQITQEITKAHSLKELFQAVTFQLSSFFNGEFAILLADEDLSLVSRDLPLFLKDEKELAVAQWTLKNGKSAGWSTDTLPSVHTLYIPMKGIDTVVGVLAYRPKIATPLLIEESNIIHTVAQQLAIYLERHTFEEKTRKIRYNHHVDHIQQTIIDLVSQEFDQPLASLIAAKESLNSPQIIENPREFSNCKDEVSDAIESLGRAVANFKEMARLSSGISNLHATPHDLSQFVYTVCNKMKRSLENHLLVIKIPPSIPKITFDENLLEIVLREILLNAVYYSPIGTTIEISAKPAEDHVSVTISDQGPGIPPIEFDRIFEKFYQVPGARKKGSGLGLSVAKSIIEFHLGRIEVYNKREGGAALVIILPFHGL
jgi:two-component system, OmpR family, sensor histidine kinase KdpD